MCLGRAEASAWVGSLAVRQDGGLDQLFSGLNFFSSSGTSVSKAQKEIKDHPNSGKGYRDLATAYEGKGDSVNAISALQQYTVQKPKDAAAWSELGGLQFTQAQNYLSAYQAASNARQLAAPSTAFLPTGKLGQGIGTNQIEQAAASQVDATLQDLQSRTQLAYTNAVGSYQKAAELIGTTTVANATKLKTLAPCATGADKRGCARAFVQSFGALAYRAPVVDAADIDRHLAVYDPATKAVSIISGTLQGKTYSTPSGAAVAVVSAHNPAINPNRNGWSF